VQEDARPLGGGCGGDLGPPGGREELGDDGVDVRERTDQLEVDPHRAVIGESDRAPVSASGQAEGEPFRDQGRLAGSVRGDADLLRRAAQAGGQVTSQRAVRREEGSAVTRSGHPGGAPELVLTNAHSMVKVRWMSAEVHQVNLDP
jgi:hypothetical protein